VNQDGNPDVVTTDFPGQSISVLLGNATGGFATAVRYLVPNSNPTDSVLGDFNNDNKLDVVVITASGFFILIGNGDGTFGSATSLGSGCGGPTIVAGDLNKDGKLDVVASCLGSHYIGVKLGNGNGQFGALQTYTVPNDCYSVALGDFNGDTYLDVVTSDGSLSNTSSVLLNNGMGVFGTPTQYTVPGPYPTALGVADFNHDGKTDIIVGSLANTASIWRGNGDGTFTQYFNTPQLYGIGENIKIADINADGFPDIVTAGTYAFSVFFGLADGTLFECSVNDGPIGVNSPHRVAVADFNHDGKLDLVGNDSYNSQINVLLA